jgi:short-subunit dehydrogenase
MDIKGKRAVVTGASTGIGRDIAERLLLEGAIVVASSRSITKGDMKGNNLYLLDANLSKTEEVDRLFDYAIETMGGIDLFIANAGFGFFERMGDGDKAHYLDIYDINVFSVIYAANKLKTIKGNDPFNFLITSSAMGYLSLPGYALYSSTKAAVRGFADAFRYELNNGQYIQCLFPIATETPFFKNAGNIPNAWPLQRSEVVAKKTIKAIKRNKSHIFPSFMFRFFYFLTVICPPLVNVYNKSNMKKFLDYQKSQGKE